MFLEDHEVINNLVLLIVNKLADLFDILVDLFLNILNLLLELGVTGVYLRRLHQFKSSSRGLVVEWGHLISLVG